MCERMRVSLYSTLLLRVRVSAPSTLRVIVRVSALHSVCMCEREWEQVWAIGLALDSVRER